MELPTASASCKLFVGGLSAQTTTEMLRGHFYKYGRIVDVVVMSKQGRPRGFGFVTFELASAATMALSEQQWLGDRFVDVKRAVPGEQPAERAPNKIFAGGLPQDATTEDLRACFAHYGPIADAVVMVDRRTQRSRGFGFIRFASGVQGTHATEAVLSDAANHWLGGKWIEVKRATPAALLQELSPSSCAMSPSCTPTHQQQKAESLLSPWLCDTPTSMAAHSPQHQQARGLSCQLGFGGTAMPGSYGMYNSYWGALGHSYGLGWEAAAEQSPVFTPSRHFSSCESPSFLSSTPLTGASATGMVGPSLRLGAEVGGGFGQAVESERSTSDGCSTSGGSDSGEENKPAAANRAVTPPPGRLSKKPMPPPGLGIEASPMKVECLSKCFEGLCADDRSGGLLGEFLNARPLCTV